LSLAGRGREPHCRLSLPLPGTIPLPFWLVWGDLINCLGCLFVNDAWSHFSGKWETSKTFWREMLWILYLTIQALLMRLLFLSDIHFRMDWYRWISNQKSDLTAIAGDLLDGFQLGGLLPQMLALNKWVDRFPGCLALSSGNHDGNFEDWAVAGEIAQVNKRADAAAILSAPHWMDVFERPSVITDRRSEILKTPAGVIVVSTIPFFPGVQGPRVCSALWDEGHRQRTTSGAPWIVLHHEPPADTMVGGHSGDPSLFYKIREYQPDFVLSGHIHAQPYSGAFADRIGATWCFNPGLPIPSRAVKAKVPNHIVLDTSARTATWHATPNVGRLPIINQIRLQ
jgi:predicted phosphodiesterase